MPSPEDRLTLRQIAKELGEVWSTVAGWRDRGIIKRVGVGRRRADLFLWKDVMRLSRIPGATDRDAMIALCPTGHISSTEAAAMMGVTDRHINKMIRLGKLRGTVVPFPGVVKPGQKRRLMCFADRAAVDEMIERRELDRHGNFTYLPAFDVGKPLISACNETCLAARRAEFERRREESRKLRNCVARKKRSA